MRYCLSGFIARRRPRCCRTSNLTDLSDGNTRSTFQILLGGSVSSFRCRPEVCEAKPRQGPLSKVRWQDRSVKGVIAAISVMVGLVAVSAAWATPVQSRCVSVRAGGGLERKVSSTLGRRYVAVAMKAVRSRDYKQVWFVSATVYYRLRPPKIYPVWAVSSLTGTGRVFAANHVATVASPGLGMLPHVSGSDDGLQRSIECARGR